MLCRPFFAAGLTLGRAAAEGLSCALEGVQQPSWPLSPLVGAARSTCRCGQRPRGSCPHPQPPPSVGNQWFNYILHTHEQTTSGVAVCPQAPCQSAEEQSQATSQMHVGPYLVVAVALFQHHWPARGSSF